MGWSGTWLTWCTVVESVETSITLVDDVFAQVSVESEAFSTVLAHLVVRSMSTHSSVVTATIMQEGAWLTGFTHRSTHGTKRMLNTDSTSVEVHNGLVVDRSNDGTG